MTETEYWHVNVFSVGLIPQEPCQAWKPVLVMAKHLHDVLQPKTFFSHKLIL